MKKQRWRVINAFEGGYDALIILPMLGFSWMEWDADFTIHIGFLFWGCQIEYRREGW